MPHSAIRSLAAPLALLFVLGAAAPREPLSPAALTDAHVINDLLTRTFYKPLTEQTVLAGMRSGILAYAGAHKLHATLPAPQLQDQRDPEAYFAKIVKTAASQTGASSSAVAYAALHGMALSANDRWTEYFDPDEYKQFDSALDPPDISGIGVLLNVDPKTKCGTAFFVIPQSPADRTGVQSGDLITAVDGTPVCGLAQPLISKRLRGTTGSTVNVTVRRGDATKDFAITRAPVQVPTVFFRMLPGGIAYINVLVFGSPTPAEFSEALRRMQSLGARGYVLDLRDDGGGYVLSAVSIASHFISSGPIFSTVSKEGEITTETDAEPPQVSAPLAVLVNQNTASASEITASALQENQVAEVIGTRTFGKGVEQTVTRLPDGSAVKITTARYVTAQNHDLNGVGLQPDVHVTENPSAQFGQIGKDAQLQAAMTYLQSKLPS